VGTGCKAHKEQRGRGVTESRNWTAPVHLRGKFPLPLNSDIAAVTAQPWAEATGDYLLIQVLHGISHDLIRKAEEKPFFAVAGGGLYLSKDG
jgi:hypothetical protein